MKDNIKVLVEEKDLQKRISEIAAQISKDFEGESVLLVCILKGSIFFTADLARYITIPVMLDFMSVSSYGNGTESVGEIRLKHDLDDGIMGKNVVIVEDIIDSGNTLNFLLKILGERRPKALKICTLLDKPSRRKVDIKVDYTGFEIEDNFVVGYGMDYAQEYRALPYIGMLDS
ncbi:MAG: hypoxanthine phosphoribosyltransferase [Lachnospiraceae bacterium]|nr:hypoxanthine phosphoribosyltransferase [Lachnospiraceae bacterium]